MIDPSIITAFAAVGGSLVGGLSSFATTYFTQRHQVLRTRLAKELGRRERLYSRFIERSATLFIDSLDKTLEDPAQLLEMFALVGRIRLTASQGVLDTSEAVMQEIIASYRRAPVDRREFLIEEGVSLRNPIIAFTAACRREREQLLAAL